MHMHWKQFFTPVSSITPQKAKEILTTQPQKNVLLDVRQPAEYQEGHISGARLMPLPLLSDSLNQLNRDTPTIVYCRSGARSRVASQMLVDGGFSTVMNLEGGILAWDGKKAVGEEGLGIPLFQNLDSLEDILKTSYSLEEGLQDFYIAMMRQATDTRVTALFHRLIDFEDIHNERIFEEYCLLTGENDRQGFQEDLEKECLEGGLSTEEYLNIFQPDLENPIDVISLAMSIEAQAEDLYTRAARLATVEKNRKVLLRIAREECSHLEQLGTLLEDLTDNYP